MMKMENAPELDGKYLEQFTMICQNSRGHIKGKASYQVRTRKLFEYPIFPESKEIATNWEKFFTE